jgi:hypothetical protein
MYAMGDDNVLNAMPALEAFRCKQTDCGAVREFR